MTFSGIPQAAVDFYRELEQHNTREWWQAHKSEYEQLVRRPFEELAVELVRFGEPKVFRPYRDVRFAADKSPYKTHQGLYVATHPRAGWYVEVSASGLRMGGGSYFMDARQLSAYRTAVAHDLLGPQLERIIADLEGYGYRIGGEKLSTRPRGVPADAPRMELLRHKSLDAMLELETPKWLSTPEAAGWITDCWEEVSPLVGWLQEMVGAGDVGER